MMNAKELIARAETLLFTREHIALEKANADLVMRTDRN